MQGYESAKLLRKKIEIIKLLNWSFSTILTTSSNVKRQIVNAKNVHESSFNINSMISSNELLSKLSTLRHPVNSHVRESSLRARHLHTCVSHLCNPIWNCTQPGDAATRVWQCASSWMIYKRVHATASSVLEGSVLLFISSIFYRHDEICPLAIYRELAYT